MSDHHEIRDLRCPRRLSMHMGVSPFTLCIHTAMTIIDIIFERLLHRRPFRFVDLSVETNYDSIETFREYLDEYKGLTFHTLHTNCNNHHLHHI